MRTTNKSVIRMGDITKFDDMEIIDVEDMKSKKCCDTCKYYEWYYDKCNKYNCEVDDRAVCSSHKERKQDDFAETIKDDISCCSCKYYGNIEPCNVCEGYSQYL